ncbi:phage baseplate assembly protein V [Thalassospira sp. MIT1370]|uniref:phage baseplate assembly protein V n=1 Tax=unclassified Thalassospira TaxID=2648997 RepID=UPI00399B5B76
MDRISLIFNRLIQPLRRRVMLMVSRAVIKVVNDAGGIQKLQIVGYDGELLEGVERLQEYGLTSVPLGNAEAVATAVGGNRSHTIVIAVDDRRFRLKNLAPGEVALYDDLGQKVHLKRDGILIETGQPSGVTVNAPAATVNAPAATVNSDTVTTNATEVTVNAAKAVINSDEIHLGAEGGQPIARVGDLVDVASGSSAGQWPIVSGSDKVRAG